MTVGLEQFWPKVLQRWCGEVVLFEFERAGQRRTWRGRLVRVNGSGPVVEHEEAEARVCPWEALLAAEVVTAKCRR